jgi:hypothetical protein
VISVDLILTFIGLDVDFQKVVKSGIGDHFA